VNGASAEGFGVALLEAMALGIPVVAVASGGPLEFVEPERSGLLVPDPEPASLAAGIERLLVEDGLRERLGEGGRARHRESFTAERWTDELTSQFESLARPTDGRAPA
jgi:glycosyltransferase involved in cell wall biosynthesis